MKDQTVANTAHEGVVNSAAPLKPKEVILVEKRDKSKKKKVDGAVSMKHKDVHVSGLDRTFVYSTQPLHKKKVSMTRGFNETKKKKYYCIIRIPTTSVIEITFFVDAMAAMNDGATDEISLHEQKTKQKIVRLSRFYLVEGVSRLHPPPVKAGEPLVSFDRRNVIRFRA